MCDGSDYAVGAVLGQRVDMKLNVSYYASHLMALKEIMLLLKNSFQL
jgi:hypothetical protein